MQPKHTPEPTPFEARTVECLKVLAGVPDPTEFIAAAKECLASLKEIANLMDPIKGWESPEDVHRIASKAITRAEKAFGKLTGGSNEK